MDLYSLQNDYIELQELIENEDAELDEIMDLLEAIEDEIDVKAENYAKIITHQNYNIKSLDGEIKRLKNRKDTLENKVKWLKDSLKEAMITTGKERIKTDIFNINVVNNSQASLEILDEDLIPEEYYYEKVTTELDKERIRHDIGIGQSIEGVKLTRGKHIRIK